MHGNIADGGLGSTFVFEGGMVKNNVAGKGYVLLRDFIVYALGVDNLRYAVCGYLCVRSHNYGKGNVQHTVHNKGDILNNRKNIACADGVYAVFHTK